MEQYILDSFPIASHMQLHVVSFDENSLAVQAPLQPNKNDKGTAFAGSLYSTMVLTGWMYISWRLKQEGIDAEVVATAANIQYLKPVVSDFQAVCRLPNAAVWERFTNKLQRRKNYKIHLPVEVSIEGEIKTRLDGEYIAWLKSVQPYGA
jgi:thioesterase domain-containing protein